MAASQPHHPRLPERVRVYRYTAAYLVVAVTVILGLLVWDRVEPAEASFCIPQAAMSKGVHAWNPY